MGILIIALGNQLFDLFKRQSFIGVLFQTAAGYIDAVYSMHIVDSTPIPVTGAVHIVDAVTGEALTNAQRGQTLSVNIDFVNTDALSVSWLIDGELVSGDWTFFVDEQYLGKHIHAEVTGGAPYVGTLATAEVCLQKLSRTLSTPVISDESSGSNVVLKKTVHVGDDTLVYGYSRTPDSADVETWSASNAIVLPEDGFYYLFVKAPGSDIYAEVISDPVLYNNVPELKFTGAALMLQHNLAISYKVNPILFETYGYENPYVVFELNGEANSLFIDEKTFNNDNSVSLASYSFGQTFNVTPLQLIRAQAATINGGYLYEPYDRLMMRFKKFSRSSVLSVNG